MFEFHKTTKDRGKKTLLHKMFSKKTHAGWWQNYWSHDWQNCLEGKYFFHKKENLKPNLWNLRKLKETQKTCALLSYTSIFFSFQRSFSFGWKDLYL